ncbi:hypothetical protein ES703_11751 [subsurface metagenome]
MATLHDSDRKALIHHFTQLGICFNDGMWLPKRNRYRRDCIEKISRDTRPSRSIRQTHMAQYIAASSLLHCLDGWGYLGRSIDCHTRGDADSARHMGYYAELRAAMSILATEGIGVFDTRHFVVISPRECRELTSPRGRTHRITWIILKNWADSQISADLLGEIITPGGEILKKWLSIFGATLHPVGIKWLNEWGLDLKRLSEDRDARNEASYRPTRLIHRNPLNTTLAASFLYNLWDMTEPSGSSRFEKLDSHLLRLSLSNAYKGMRKLPGGFQGKIEVLLNALSISGFDKERWKRFLMEREEAAIIREASGTVTVNHPRHHIQVISRGALLLRIATGACARLLRDCEIDRTHLEFWWRPLGEERGFWTPGAEPDYLTDLWLDVKGVLDDEPGWEDTNSSSFPDWWKSRPKEFAVLGECERIGLWGLEL